MAASNSEIEQCVRCGKAKNRSFPCKGCSKMFCNKCFPSHLHELSGDLDEIVMQCDQFRQTLNEQMKDPNKHALIDKINKWERESMEKIKAVARESRQLLQQEIKKHFGSVEKELSELTNKIKGIRAEDDFNETHLKELREKLKQLECAIDKPANVSVKQDDGAFIKKISVVVVTPSKCHY